MGRFQEHVVVPYRLMTIVVRPRIVLPVRELGRGRGCLAARVRSHRTGAPAAIMVRQKPLHLPAPSSYPGVKRESICGKTHRRMADPVPPPPLGLTTPNIHTTQTGGTFLRDIRTNTTYPLPAPFRLRQALCNGGYLLTALSGSR